MYLMMTPSETEKLLTFTDKDTLERYVSIRKKQQEEDRLKELYKDAVDLDDMFEYDETSQEASHD